MFGVRPPLLDVCFQDVDQQDLDALNGAQWLSGPEPYVLLSHLYKCLLLARVRLRSLRPEPATATWDAETAKIGHSKPCFPRHLVSSSSTPAGFTGQGGLSAWRAALRVGVVVVVVVVIVVVVVVGSR